MDEIIKRKSIGGMVLYVLLMSLAMLAIFDTQVLSVFRRRREIGTNIALGMTRGQVIRLFTVEGAMHGILAAVLAAAYGVPLLAFQARRGFSMPQGSDDYGLAIAEKIIPVYSAGLVIGTTLLVLVTVTVVSFIPAGRIARINPTDALRGRLP
jgi:ABC-type lipoprotein release transport system permease subunit